jgi:hypothetical protein
MDAWQVVNPGPIDTDPLELTELPRPQPMPGEILVRVRCCGVCRTDLHIAEGDLPLRMPNVVPGHQIVGVVEARGEGATRFRVGDRIGIAWLRFTCGRCRFCTRGLENLCPDARFTGWDVDGGYAEYAVADERYAYRLPSAFSDERAAPLLCAGIIGYRVLQLARLPPGGRLRIYGFGCVRAPNRADRGPRGCDRPRRDAFAPCPGSRVGAGSRFGRRALGSSAGTARCSDPVRPRGRAGSDRARGARARGGSYRSLGSISARSHSSTTPDTSSMSAGS